MTDRARRIPVLLAALLAAAVVLAACGGDDGRSGARQGGSIAVAYGAQPDALDPALSYTAEAWEALWLVYTPLLTYRHAEGDAGAEIVPGLAESLPDISRDGKTYRLKLRGGLEYSDATPVRASDFEHAIKRVLALESGGSSFYLGIEGAEEYVEAGDERGDIAGIDADDRTGEITITLKGPDATFTNALAMTFTGLVPGDTPFENLTKAPPPGVGAYAIASSVPNREFVLERSESFPGFDGVPQANIDRLTVKIMESRPRQTQAVIDGTLDYMQSPPPPDLKPTVRQRHGDRYKEFATASTYFFFLNHDVPPFDDPKVREAVNIGLNRAALARLYAGELEPGCSFLPPGMPGYAEELDGAGCPFGEPTQPPQTERARQLIREAGAEGAKVTVWGNDEEPTPKVVAAYVDMLDELGLDAEQKVLDAGVYFQTVGNAKTKAQTGFAAWFQDFPHPATFFAIVDGDAIQPTNGINLGRVDDERIDGTVDALSRETRLQRVAGEWGELNRHLVESAHLAPYGHRKLTTFMSERMDFADCSLVHPVYQNDYSSWCLK